MNGGSLGLRSGSYGALHQQQQQPSIALVRKNSKMFGSRERERERRVSTIFKIESRRRKLAMLMLLVASVAVVISFFFAIAKDELQHTGPEFMVGNLYHVRNFISRGKISSVRLSPPSISVSENNNKHITSILYAQHASFNNEALLPPRVFYSIAFPSQHPCQNFALPPLPVDPKRTGPRSCNVCYVPLKLAMAYMPALPSVSPILKNLNYLLEDNLSANESNGGSIFGGYPSLQQRDESYNIKESMSVHCGFVKGRKPGQGTGFDIDEADLLEMEQCRGLVIASAIFGNYDVMQQPKNIGEYSKKTACFYMFVDVVTEASIKNSNTIDSTKRVGLWRVVVVWNLPYVDARRNGKVPKLLLHRIFPNARFSLWIDGKLELVVDPYQILERFLWRDNATFAISRHYRRFDVFEEAEANKAAAKYDNASIDNQIEFYRREGLTHFSPAKYPIISDVPEGCVIIREHIPITNLFTCLWFNEVDRFTSRDQLSFSTVRDKIMSKVNWSINMFMDCERRNFVLQSYHRDILEQRVAFISSYIFTQKSFRKPTPNPVSRVLTRRLIPSRKPSVRHGRDRKSDSRRHRLRRASRAMDPN